MKYTIVDVTGTETPIYARTPKNKTLGDLFGKYEDKIAHVKINDKWVEGDAWLDHKIVKTDNIAIYAATEDLVSIAINILLSVIFSAIAALFAPKPKKPSQSKNQPALGVAGIQNTLAPGTPKFIPYGTRKVFGHLIASKVDLANTLGRADTGTQMSFSALYFMGVGQLAAIRDVKINRTHLCDIYGPPEAYYRLGTQDQTIIPGHELVHQTYHDGREIEIPPRPSKSKTHFPGPGKPITYTTKGKCDKVTLFIHFPNGLWSFGVHGKRYSNFVGVRVQYKRNTDTPGIWSDFGVFNSVTTSTTEGFFWKIELDMPDNDQWDLQINEQIQYGHGSFENAPTMTLFNVMETQFIQTAYPGNALLEVHGVANEQITGFDNMETSAIVDGRLVEVYRNGIYVREFSRNRVWIIRDILLDRSIGLGNRLSPVIWDNGAGLKASNYYEETVTNYNDELEQRDFCDVIINEVKSGWDHLKILLYEGRGILIPSSGKFKYVLDIDRAPSLLHSFPGNIVEDSLTVERGSAELAINTIRAEFPDVERDYAVVPAKVVSDDIGDDPERPDQISFTSIVRKSQISRELHFRLKQKTQIKKRWSWKAPRNAVTSEPFDIDNLAYRTSKHTRGYTGFIHGNDSTTTSIATGKEIYLEAGVTHSVHVRQNSTVEERTLTNPLGQTHSILTFSTPLTFTPKTGDIWVAAKTQNQLSTIQIDDVEFDGENFTIKAHEHIPAVYTDVLSDVTELENAISLNYAYPPPLLDAQAVHFADGAGLTVGYLFNVVPSFNFLSGTYSALGTNTIILSLDEPDRDDFFNGAFVEADLDFPRRIVDYEGATRIAVVEEAFSLANTQTGIYDINWPTFSGFYGFEVEGWNGSSWVDIDSAVGTSLSVLTGSTYSLFRFIPFNINEVGNSNSMIEVDEGRDDLIAPSPPLRVKLEIDATQDALATIDLTAPLSRDTQYIKTEFAINVSSGNPAFSVFTDISGYRNEKSDSSITQLSIPVNRDLSGYDAGVTASVVASVIDFFGNRSIEIPSFETVTLSGDEQDTPVELPIDAEDGIPDDPIITGSTISLLWSDTIDAGVIGNLNSLQLDLSLLVTPGSTTTTEVDFHYCYGGLTASIITAEIANGVSAIADDTPYQLTFRLDPVAGSAGLQQFTTSKKVGTEVTGNNYIRTSEFTINIDSNQNQLLEIYADIQGDTTTMIEVVNAVLKQIVDTATVSNEEPYIVSGTVPGRLSPTTNYVQVHPVPIEVEFLTDLTTSFGHCVTGPSADATFSLKKNGTEFGTMTFPAGLTTATFIATNSLFSAGDIFTITPPSPFDANLSDIGWSIHGVRN